MDSAPCMFKPNYLKSKTWFVGERTYIEQYAKNFKLCHPLHRNTEEYNREVGFLFKQRPCIYTPRMFCLASMLFEKLKDDNVDNMRTIQELKMKSKIRNKMQQLKEERERSVRHNRAFEKSSIDDKEPSKGEHWQRFTSADVVKLRRKEMEEMDKNNVPNFADEDTNFFIDNVTTNEDGDENNLENIRNKNKIESNLSLLNSKENTIIYDDANKSANKNIDTKENDKLNHLPVVDNEDEKSSDNNSDRIFYKPSPVDDNALEYENFVREEIENVKATTHVRIADDKKTTFAAHEDNLLSDNDDDEPLDKNGLRKSITATFREKPASTKSLKTDPKSSGLRYTKSAGTVQNPKTVPKSNKVKSQSGRAVSKLSFNDSRSKKLLSDSKKTKQAPPDDMQNDWDIPEFESEYEKRRTLELVFETLKCTAT
ncbi:hypothetical protein HELRODRAFT_174731 [Helobdella robusta]|uniref:Uncharacterized protein n=1 Tax=Helobdella robusta TaxID=6412 RepID=T1F8F0_HELRO|nr:hypothetical protein HELRODRAFT_174731 [Helobdella robusta]ESO01747.1 hypothetical protein HELRODRAFT_174731 [Helobdella robusta]